MAASDFDQYFNQVLELARKEGILTAFSALTTDQERAEAVLALDLLKGYTVRDSYRQKNETEAKVAMEKADALCLKGSPRRALAIYSTAVRLSPSSSQILRSSLQARALLLHRLGFYGSALRDLEWVIATEVTEEVTETKLRLGVLVGSCYQNTAKWEEAERSYNQTLDKLRESHLTNEIKAVMAVELIQRLKQTKQREQQKMSPPMINECRIKPVPDLSYGHNTNIPSCSSVISLRWNPEKGRHMVANEDINIGSVLIVESPYAWSLPRNAIDEHCLHCCCLLIAPIPCVQCATVNYCSTQCRDDAWLAYHSHECEVLDHFFHSTHLSMMALVVYRILLTSAFNAGDKVAKEPPTLSPLFTELHNISEGRREDANNTTSRYLSNDYRSVFNQITNSSHRSAGDLFKRTVTAVFLMRCLQKVVARLGDEVTITAAFLRHLQSCSCNAYQMNEHSVPGGDVRLAEGRELGGAVYPAISLCNHSCNPNIARHSYGRVCVVRALRSISKDDQLFDNYGPHFLTHPSHERAKLLREQYSFECKCEPCVQQWPTSGILAKQRPRYKCAECSKNPALGLKTNCGHSTRISDVKKPVKRLQEMAKKYETALASLLNGQVEDCLAICIKYATFLEASVVQPSIELVRCQQTISQCWSLMANVDDRNRNDDSENAI